MSTVGTPDWQRGTVGAQVLFGPFSSMVLAEVIGLPANAKAIHILQAPAAVATFPTVTGNTTNTAYPVFKLTTAAGGADQVSHVALVDPSADQQVTVTLPASPSSNWYVIADQSPLLNVDLVLEQVVGKNGFTGPTLSVQVAGQDASNVLHPLLIDALGRLETADQVLDLSTAATGAVAPADAVQVGGTDTLHLQALRVNRQGLPYTIPSAPSIVTGDHPPQELLTAHLTGQVQNAAVIAAPGAGKRIRLYWLTLTSQFVGSGTGNALAVDSVAGGQLLIAFSSTTFAGTAVLSGYPSGIPLSNNGALQAAYNAASAGGYDVAAVYTVETI